MDKNQITIYNEKICPIYNIYIKYYTNNKPLTFQIDILLYVFLYFFLLVNLFYV